MSEAKLLLESIEQKEDCNFCTESRLDVGERSGHGAAIIYKTGQNPETGWVATANPSTLSDPAVGINLVVYPVGHLEYFSQVNSNPDLGRNFGEMFAKVSYAMQMARQHEWDESLGLFVPSGIAYGKCGSEFNTIQHLHMRLIDTTAGMNQPFPCDTAHVKKDRFGDAMGEDYVRSMPVEKTRIPAERFDSLTSLLIEYANN